MEVITATLPGASDTGLTPQRVRGPRTLPVIREEQAAREALERAVLSAMAHGRDEQAGPEVVQAVVGAVRGLEDERSSFNFDRVLSS
jgi:hypothetical protein